MVFFTDSTIKITSKSPVNHQWVFAPPSSLFRDGIPMFFPKKSLPPLRAVEKWIARGPEVRQADGYQIEEHGS